MDRAEIQSCSPSLSPRVSHPERGRTRFPGLNEGSLKHKQALSEKHLAVQSASASASGGVSAGASGAAGAGAVTAESLSDPALGYTVVSIPKDLDATQTKVLQDYVAYDKATWRVWSTREGLDDALNRSTGSTRDEIQTTYDAMTDQDNPPVKIGVGDIEVSKDEQSADVTMCLDRTQVTSTDFQGNDATHKEKQRRIKILVRMVPSERGVWVTERETKVSINECTAEAGK